MGVGVELMKRLFFIAPFLPEGHGGVSVNYRLRFNEYPADRLFWYSTRGGVGTSWRPAVRRANSPKFISSGYRFRFSPLRQRSRLFRWALTRCELMQLGRCLRSFSPDVVVLYVVEELIELHHVLTRGKQVSYHLSIGDDPVNAVGLNRGHRRYTERIARQLGQLMAAAKSRDVICERMRVRYMERYGVDSTVIGPLSSVRESLRVLPEPGRPVNIVYSGGPWCKTISYLDVNIDPFQLLLNGIDELNQPSPRYTVTLFGGFSVPYRNRCLRQETNWLSDGEYQSRLDEMHLGFADDPVANEFGREFARTSLPGKVVNYICQRLPFLYCGPRDSSVGDVVKNYRCGLVVENFSQAGIMSAVHTLLREYEDFGRECERAARDLFDASIHRERFIGSVVA